MNGWICWEDDHNMGCEFPFKVCVPGLKTEPIYSGDGRMIQKGTEIPDRYGKLFVKSENIRNMEKKSLQGKSGDMLVEEFADWLVPKCLFSEDDSNYADNTPLLNVMMKINGVDIFLYPNYVMRGTRQDEYGGDKVDVIFIPFSTEEPECSLDSRIDDDRENALRDLYNWNLYVVYYNEKGKPYLNF